MPKMAHMNFSCCKFYSFVPAEKSGFGGMGRGIAFHTGQAHDAEILRATIQKKGKDWSKHNPATFQ